MPKPSASSLQRSLACPASNALPQVASSSKHSERGSAIHRFLERVGTVGRDKALDEVDDEFREVCEIIDVDSLPVELSTEVTFAADFIRGTAREIGRNLDRDYSEATKDEICGTADVVGVGEDFVYVADYKTGRTEIPPAGENAQLLFLAACAASVYRKERARVEIIKVRDGRIWKDAAEVDFFALESFKAELTRAYVGFRAAEAAVNDNRMPNVNEGGHCRYCPAFNSCPAKTALALSIMEQPALPALTVENFPEFDKNYRIASDFMKRLTKQRYAFIAENGPVPLGNGKMIGERERLGNEKLDGNVAFGVIAGALGPVAAEEATKRTVTKKSISTVIRKYTDEGFAKTEREIVEGIRSAGGSERVMRKTIEEYEGDE